MDEIMIKNIVREVLMKTNLDISCKSDQGVFEDVNDAIDAAYIAQRDWYMNYKVEDRRRIIEAIRVVARENAPMFAKMIHEETGMGRYEDKITKNLAVIDKTPGVECLVTDAISGDSGLMIEEQAPFGVIGAITPSTNPTETIINNTISMIGGGNTSGRKESLRCLPADPAQNNRRERRSCKPHHHAEKAGYGSSQQTDCQPEDPSDGWYRRHGNGKCTS